MQLAIHRDNELAIHRDNEPVGNNKVLKGCLIGFLVVILIGFVVLAVVLRQIGQAIDGFFEGVREFFEHPLKTLSVGFSASRPDAAAEATTPDTPPI